MRRQCWNVTAVLECGSSAGCDGSAECDSSAGCDGSAECDSSAGCDGSAGMRRQCGNATAT